MVGLLIYDTRGETIEVDTFLLSCRVLGRGVEHRVLARLGEIGSAAQRDELSYEVCSKQEK